MMTAEPLPRPWRRMALSFLVGGGLMGAMLAFVAPAAPPPPAPAAGDQRAVAVAAALDQVVGRLDNVALRRLDDPAAIRPETAALLAQEVVSLSDRVLTTPDRVRRLLDGSSAPPACADALAGEIDGLLDRRLDYLLAATDVLEAIRVGVPHAPIAEMRAKRAALDRTRETAAGLAARFSGCLAGN